MTAITRSVNFIHALRTSSGSHERIAVVELFGRYCGETSLVSAYLAVWSVVQSRKCLSTLTPSASFWLRTGKTTPAAMP